MADKFEVVVHFLAEAGNSTDCLEAKHLHKLAEKFKKGRAPKRPQSPKTISDKMVYFILETYFGIKSSDLGLAENHHKLAMAAENIIGDILERYIASVIEPSGWVWCSGSVIRSVDFIYKVSDSEWIALQVKNRDNSENSSSSAIRKGTSIIKWFRTFSKKEGYNWDSFPSQSKFLLSEQGFKEFTQSYFAQIRE